MIEEERIPFSDYTPAQQKRDVEKFEKLKLTDVYVMRVNGVWNGYMPDKDYPVAFTGKSGEELTSFIKGLKLKLEEKYNIKPNFHNIINKGVEDYLKQQMIVQKLLER